MLFNPTEILLPQGVDLARWAVIACDQFSSEREYWDAVCAEVGDAPSALNLIIPEAYLNDPELREREKKIGTTAESYCNNGVFATYPGAYIYLERTLRSGAVRRGLVGAIDLDAYEYAGNTARCRASEEMVPNRLPPRARIRSQSPIETSHAMLLINDLELRIIEPLAKKNLPLLYNIELSDGFGHLRGYLVNGDLATTVAQSIESLADGIIVGDGNHTIAAAKVIWEELSPKLTAQERECHPARFALAELNNVYDDAFELHAIHRVVFNTEQEGFINGLQAALGSYITDIGSDGVYTLECVSASARRMFHVKQLPIDELIERVQGYIDGSTTADNVDYIHGEESFDTLAAQPGNVGIYLPAMERGELFRTTLTRGAFPRKSFSLGEAWDKRFYLECRKITK